MRVLHFDRPFFILLKLISYKYATFIDGQPLPAPIEFDITCAVVVESLVGRVLPSAAPTDFYGPMSSEVECIP